MTVFAACLLGANINDVQLGEHQAYSILVVTCDQEVIYQVKENGDEITIAFPQGTGILVSDYDLNLLKNDFFQSVNFLRTSAELTVKVKKNYKLRIYKNRRPFQLVMDFTHKPGKPSPSQPKQIQQQIQPEKEENLPPSTPTEQEEERKLDNPYQTGIKLKNQGDYQGAAEAFQQALPTVGNQALYMLALMHEELNQRETAIGELMQVINDTPRWIEPRIKLGMLYKLNGKEEKAEIVWEQILEAVEPDTLHDFLEFSSQLQKLETMLNSDFSELEKKPPLINLENFPKLPWTWILITIAVALIIIIARYIANWRLNRLLNSVMSEEDLLQEPQPARQTAPQPSETAAEEISTTDIVEEVTADTTSRREQQNTDDNVEDVDNTAQKQEGIPDELSDEKQQLIYDLAQQKYTIAEIAKMLNMGQEEVKFILDFRSSGK